MARKGAYGFNGTISTVGMGTRKIRCKSLHFGLGIITTADGEARTRRSFYPVVTTGSSFTMKVEFISYEENQQFIEWITRFMRRVAAGTARSGVLTVRVPNRDFIRICSLSGLDQYGGQIDFGEGVTDMVYEQTLAFIGASDPVNVNLGARQAGISYFKGPKRGESRYFYPAGEQLKGAEQLDGTAFDAQTSGGDYNPGVEEPYGPSGESPLDPNIPEGMDF